MKQILVILIILLLSLVSSAQISTGKIYIRKTKEVSDLESEENRSLRSQYEKDFCIFRSPSYEKISRVTSFPPCDDFYWLQPKWKIFAFPDKSKGKKYFIDKLEILDCENAKITYYTNPDSSVFPCTWVMNDEDSTLNISYKDKDGNPVQLNFEYNVFITSFINRHDIKSINPKPIVVFMDIQLKVPSKEIEYIITWGSRLENHNYVPGICRTVDDSVHSWESDFDDDDGYKHKINIINCTKIEIKHEHPWKKDKKTELKVIFLKGNRHIQVLRNPQNINDKYFYTIKSMEFVEDKLILKSKDKAFSYSKID